MKSKLEKAANAISEICDKVESLESRNKNPVADSGLLGDLAIIIKDNEEFIRSQTFKNLELSKDDPEIKKLLVLYYQRTHEAMSLRVVLLPDKHYNDEGNKYWHETKIVSDIIENKLSGLYLPDDAAKKVGAVIQRITEKRQTQDNVEKETITNLRAGIKALKAKTDPRFFANTGNKESTDLKSSPRPGSGKSSK